MRKKNVVLQVNISSHVQQRVVRGKPRSHQRKAPNSVCGGQQWHQREEAPRIHRTTRANFAATKGRSKRVSALPLDVSAELSGKARRHTTQVYERCDSMITSGLLFFDLE